MLKAFIVEDEYISRERLKRLIKEIPHVELVGEAENKREALEKIKNLMPDVVFLDVRLSDGTGIELAKEILQEGLRPYIVFITAYGEFAVEAFKVNAIDYILKPYELEDLKKAIEKVKNLEDKERNILQIQSMVESPQGFVIPIKQGGKVFLIKPEDIYYIKAEASETVIRTKEREYFSNKKLYEFENLLKAKGFFKVHRSYLVNLFKVKELRSVEQSKLIISFYDINDTIKTSRDGAKALREYLGL